MSHRLNLHDATGVLETIPGVGVSRAAGSSAPTNGAAGYAPGCEYRLYSTYSANAQVYINAGTNTSATWYAVSQPSAANTETLTALTVTGAESVGGILTPTGGLAAAGGFSATPCGQIHTGGYPAIISTSGTELTPGATTTAYIGEIFIPCNMTITGVNHFNGSAVTGNITVGLYTSAGVAIAAALSAATAGSGTDAYQAIPFATPYAALGPAKYLLVFLYSSTSARPNTHHVGTVFSLSQATFTVGTTAVSPLPTAFTADNFPMASLY